MDGKAELMGFFTTRFVEASDCREAERHAIELVQANLKEIMLNQPGDPPTFHVEEVIELAWFPCDIEPPGAGYTWYPEEQVQH